MNIDRLLRRPQILILTLIGVLALAWLFANVEIQIEGAAGWAGNLPTWRIESHWLLDIFWGGRPLTGYHAWVFPCVALFFHFPLLFMGQFSWRAEARIIACIQIFWIVEDFIWFVLNPAFGLSKFTPADVPWHIKWLGPAPLDYWTFLGVAAVLLALSCLPHKPARQAMIGARPSQAGQN
ncbi:MAG: hypothetical protein FWD68_06475 [Alphaproteobacteria bacterium]|nr:hypothetical protein [Alphaproteobacteria bacterium]